MDSSFVPLAGLAAIVFATTNVDDIFVLVGFFADPKFRARHVVTGQYLGIAALYGVSVVVSLLALVVSPAYIGILGLVPLMIGARKLYSLWRGSDSDENDPDPHATLGARNSNNIVTVAAVTIANGGDNISTYTPLFATQSAMGIGVTGLVFAAMTALWCGFAHWLVNHPALGARFVDMVIASCPSCSLVSDFSFCMRQTPSAY